MSIKALVAAVVLVAAPGVALACTPAPPPKLTLAEQIANARGYETAMASPLLANEVSKAAEISVVRIDGYDPGPLTDIPERFRGNIEWYRQADAGLEPVRYRLKVEQALKGSPPTAFIFRFRMAWTPEDGERIWTVAPSEDFQDFSNPRNGQSFWHHGRLSVGQFSGWGDCSNQIALDPRFSYLVFRDAAGLITAAEPLAADDPLPGLIAALVADPKLDYPWQPTVRQFLALPGIVARVRITSCDEERGRVIEVLRHRPDDNTGDAEKGETLHLYGLAPGFLVTSCHVGSDYLVTGWPFSTRLHPVVAGKVRFEDRWMQLRFSGEKTMPLDTVRTILAGA